MARVAEHLDHPAIGIWGITLAIALYVAYMTQRTLDVHRGLGTSAYDLGLYDQGVWLMSRFHTPFVTLMGRNLFGDHASFILLFVVPFYWVAPGVGTLLFLQALAIGLGAVPVFLYARRRLGSGLLALVCGIIYLLHPAVGWTNLENFHPDSFLAVFVGFAIYFALGERWRLYVLFAVLSMLVKEDVSLVLVPLGVWVAVKRNRYFGASTVFMSIGFTLMGMYLVMRSLIGVPTRNGWRIPFGGPSGLLKTALREPGKLFDHLRADGRPWYLWQMTAPFAWTFVRAPSVALIGSVVLFTNVLSTFVYQYLINYHYSLIVVPCLALGAVHGLAAMGDRWRRPAVTAMALMGLWTAYLWGPFGVDSTAGFVWRPSNPVAVGLRTIIQDIPDDAMISVYHSAAPHVDHRTDVYMFPNPFRVVLYGPDTSIEGQRLAIADQVEYVLLPSSRTTETETDWQAVSGDFELVEQSTGWELYQRRDDGSG